MKTTLLVLILGLGTTLKVAAADTVTQAEAVTTHRNYLSWDDPAWWEAVAKQPEPKVMIGRSDVGVTGPVMQPFARRRPTSESRNILDTLTGVPILGLFVPQPMPMPPKGGGKYFAWGERDMAWSDLADHRIPGPSAALISFSR